MYSLLQRIAIVEPARHRHDKDRPVVVASVYIHARSGLETGPFFVEDLKENIRTEIRRTDTSELHRVYDNILQHAQKCIDVQGDHFQHLL